MLNLIFRGPWYVPAAVATMLVAMGIGMYFSGTADEAAKLRALAAAQPRMVALDQFDADRDIHDAGEVFLNVVLHSGNNTKLIQTTKRKFSSTETERYMFTLFGPGDAVGARQVRAAMILSEYELDALAEYSYTRATDITDDTVTFSLSGKAKTYAPLDDLFEGRLEELGLTTHPDFRFIEPWFKGREAALAPEDVYWDVSLIFVGAGLLAFAFSYLKFRRRPKGEALAAIKAEKVVKTRKSRRKLGIFAGVLGTIYVAYQVGALTMFFQFLPILIVFAGYAFLSGQFRKGPVKAAIDAVKARLGSKAEVDQPEIAPNSDIPVASPSGLGFDPLAPQTRTEMIPETDPAPMAESEIPEAPVATKKPPKFALPVFKIPASKLPTFSLTAFKSKAASEAESNPAADTTPAPALNAPQAPEQVKKGLTLPLRSLNLPSLDLPFFNLGRGTPAKLPSSDPFERFATRMAAQNADPEVSR